MIAKKICILCLLQKNVKHWFENYTSKEGRFGDILLEQKISLTIKFEWGFAHISSRYMQTRVIISKILLAGAFALMQALPVAMQNIRIACRQLSGEVPLAKLCLG